jgi:hypothetical protein
VVHKHILFQFGTLTAQQQNNNNKQPLTSTEIQHQSLTFELLDKNERKLSLKHSLHITTKTIVRTKERPLGLKHPKKIGQRSIHFLVSDIPFSHLNEKRGKTQQKAFLKEKRLYIIRNIVSLK